MTGSIVLATEQGLGYLAKAFYDNGILDMVCIHPHSSRHNHYEWYPTNVTEQELLEKCDVLIFFETCFNWKILVKAREKGIKTILIPMYECTPNPLPYQPDEIWAPSLLDKDYYPNSKLIQIPVNIEWKLRKKARLFVHNAGNGGLGGRNGTKELIEAFRWVTSDARLLIRSQIPIKCDDQRIEVKTGTFDDIWSEGDVFIFPEKFNGLSLPLQEAFASGMAVMCGARYPMTEWLPQQMMFPVKNYKKERIAVEFKCAEYDPKDIAEMIDEWYDKDITAFSVAGKKWGSQNSWKQLKEKYRELIAA